MVHEMSILKLFTREEENNINYFPTLPSDRQEYGMIFDPASYGQWLGGTNHKHCGVGHPPGYIEPDHYIGQAINKGDISITMEDGLPYVKNNLSISAHNKFPLANLHIHTKDLRRFLHESE